MSYRIDTRRVQRMMISLRVKRERFKTWRR